MSVALSLSQVRFNVVVNIHVWALLGLFQWTSFYAIYPLLAKDNCQRLNCHICWQRFNFIGLLPEKSIDSFQTNFRHQWTI
jgi:hypothetical protein